MPIAKVFKSGNSQAIRLPKEFRLKVKEVEIVRQGDDILIRQPRKLTLMDGFNALRSMPEDFFAEGRDRPSTASETIKGLGENAVHVRHGYMYFICIQERRHPVWLHVCIGKSSWRSGDLGCNLWRTSIWCREQRKSLDCLGLHGHIYTSGSSSTPRSTGWRRLRTNTSSLAEEGPDHRQQRPLDCRTLPSTRTDTRNEQRTRISPHPQSID